jgi:imidazolonepropionase-like amidohydrolase
VRRRHGVALALLLGLLAALPAPGKKPKPSYLVFTNVTLVDMRDATSYPGMTVVIRNDRITGIARHGLIQIERNIQVVNASGRYLLAGRWDMKAGTLLGLRTAEVGQGADLLLLDAYPLSDLRDTGKVWAAVLKGKFLDRRALEKMAAEAAGKSSPLPPK